MNLEPEPLKIVPEITTQTDEIKTIESEKNKYYNLYLHARADFENYQKRSRFEADRTKEETTRKFLFELFPIWDNFQLAVTNDTENSILNSIKNQFLQFFELQGITILSTKIGDRFNPEIHEVITYEAKSDLENPIVAEVFKDGFILNKKIIRPAQVKLFINVTKN